MESIIKTVSNPVFFSVNSSYPIQTDISLDCNEADIIGVTATVLNQSCECSQGIAKGVARVMFNILYTNDRVLVYESAVDLNFEQRDDRILENSLFKLNCTCEEVKISALDNGGFSVSTVVELSVTYCVTNQISFLQDIEGAVVKTEQKKVYALQRCMQATSSVFEGEKSVNFEIERVLCHNDSVRVLQTECGIGEVIVDGEILSEFSLLTTSGEVVCSSMLTAFRYEIECDGASVDCVAFTNACIQNASFKIAFLSDENSSKIDGEYTLIFNTAVLDECAVNCVIDGFSTTNELILSSENLVFDSYFNFASFKHKCFGEGICELDADEKILCVINASVDVLQVGASSSEKGSKIDGVVYCNLLTEVNEKRKIKGAKIAFSFELDSECLSADVSATVKNVVARSLEQKCIIDCEIVFSVVEKRCDNCKCVCLAEEGEERAVNQSAISVLFISKGDDLWTVCKKALATEQNVLADNPDISFPATSDKAIVVYKSLKA